MHERETNVTSTGPLASDEGGFALLMALLALVGLTALATGGFLLSNTEHRASTNFRGSADAFYLADAGLKRYLGTQDGTPKPLSVTLGFDRGQAQIEATQLLANGEGRRMWNVTSTGIPDPPFDGMRRTVSSVIVLEPLLLEVPAGMAGATALDNNGGGGIKFEGDDQASSSDCPEGGQPSEAGVYLWDYDSGGHNVADGSPNVVETGPDDPNGTPNNPFRDLADAGRWDLGLWQDVIDQVAVEYDYVYSDPGDNNTPPAFNLGADEWAVIKIEHDGPLTDLPSTYNTVKLDDTCCSGQGILIVEGHARFSGDFTWEGLIMVGGALTNSSGTNRVYGGTLLGLNTTLTASGVTPTSAQMNTTIGAGTKEFYYNSCDALEAAREAGKLAELPGTWNESF